MLELVNGLVKILTTPELMDASKLWFSMRD